MNKKISDTLHTNIRVRALLMGVFSVICALLLWVYVTETQGEEIPKPFSGVKVVYEGETTIRDTRELIISEKTVTSANVTLVGNRRTVASLDATDLTVVVDLSDITATGNYSRAPRVTFPSRTDTSAISQVECSPGVIDFYVDKLSKKTVEVTGRFDGSAAEGFSADPLEFSPSTVIVYGPEKVLADVDRAFVEVSRTDVDRTLSFDSTFQLLDKDGQVYESDELTFDTDTVTVTIPISAVKDVALVVEIVEGGGATSENVHWSLEPNTITLTGNADALAGVNSISVARIDLSTLRENLNETYRIVIPNDTEITSGAKETTLTLELTGLYERTVSIKKNYITCINSSEGYDWEVMNDSLENVILRGPEAEVKSISELNINAVADLTDFGSATGIVSVPVKIRINGSSAVGTVGEYKVYVNITKAEERPQNITEESD